MTYLGTNRLEISSKVRWGYFGLDLISNLQMYKLINFFIYVLAKMDLKPIILIKHRKFNYALKL
jgi:hypothetical protein